MRALLLGCACALAGPAYYDALNRVVRAGDPPAYDTRMLTVDWEYEQGWEGLWLRRLFPAEGEYRRFCLEGRYVRMAVLSLEGVVRPISCAAQLSGDVGGLVGPDVPVDVVISSEGEVFDAASGVRAHGSMLRQSLGPWAVGVVGIPDQRILLGWLPGGHLSRERTMRIGQAHPSAA